MGFVSGMSMLGGAAIHAAVASKKLEKKYAEISDREIAEARLYYSRMNKEDSDGNLLDPEDLALAAAAKDAGVPEGLIESLGYIRENPLAEPVLNDDFDDDDEAVVEVVREVTVREEVVAEKIQGGTQYRHRENPEHPFDENALPKATEVKPPLTPDPYVISNEDFLRGELDYTQRVIEYYAGDDVLVDEMDRPVSDPERLVGGALEQFGFKSKRGDLVYVRNEQHETDFEISRNSGTYEEQVAGFKHSQQKVGKFREGRAT